MQKRASHEQNEWSSSSSCRTLEESPLLAELPLTLPSISINPAYEALTKGPPILYNS